MTPDTARQNRRNANALVFTRMNPRTLFWAAAVFVAMMAMAASALARSAPESFADLAAKLLPSVVNISTTQVLEGRTGENRLQVPPGSPFEDFFKEFFDRQQRNPERGPGPGPERRATSLGSGFVIASEGLVVTNNHVIQDADEITVVLQDNTRLEAKVVGRDKKTDLAVLRVKPEKPLVAVPWGNSDVSRVGDWVVAIGNPFGLGGTVTAGIISARGRDINAGPYDDFIQTDASINRGNSGGPMFNVDGQVIGINTAIFSPTGGSVGIGFAIPSSVAQLVVRQLAEHGEVRRGWLGVHIQQVTGEIAETLGLDKPRGALIANVADGGPAAKAGIKAGDVVLKFDSREVEDMRKLPRIVAETEVGKPVKVKLWRKGKEVALDVTVGVLEEEPKKVASRSLGGGAVELKPLGVTVATLTDQLRERFKIETGIKGVVVTDVAGNGPAASKGVRPGDVIIEVSQEEVDTPAEVRRLVGQAVKDDRKQVLLLLEGQGGLRFVAVKLTEG